MSFIKIEALFDPPFSMTISKKTGTKFKIRKKRICGDYGFLQSIKISGS